MGLLVLLGYNWGHAARPLTPLGLDIPLSKGGMIGLVIVAVLFLVAAVIISAKKFKNSDSDRDIDPSKLSDDDTFLKITGNYQLI